MLGRLRITLLSGPSRRAWQIRLCILCVSVLRQRIRGVHNFCQSTLQPREDTVEYIKSRLASIPDTEIFPKISAITTVFKPQTVGPGLYLKNSTVKDYEHCKDEAADFVARLCLGEALVYEILARNPHPNVARYHGCLVRRERIIGMVLDRYPTTLLEKVGYAKDPSDIDPDFIMESITSGIRHLHSLGLAHNELHPKNIMMDASNNPVIVDLGSCRPPGAHLMSSGTPIWAENDGAYVTSATQHNIYSLGKINAWLKDPGRKRSGGGLLRRTTPPPSVHGTGIAEPLL